MKILCIVLIFGIGIGVKHCYCQSQNIILDTTNDTDKGSPWTIPPQTAAYGDNFESLKEEIKNKSGNPTMPEKFWEEFNVGGNGIWAFAGYLDPEMNLPTIRFQHTAQLARIYSVEVSYFLYGSSQIHFKRPNVILGSLDGCRSTNASIADTCNTDNRQWNTTVLKLAGCEIPGEASCNPVSDFTVEFTFSPAHENDFNKGGSFIFLDRIVAIPYPEDATTPKTTKSTSTTTTTPGSETTTVDSFSVSLTPGCILLVWSALAAFSSGMIFGS